MNAIPWACQLPESQTQTPRFREAGYVTLDHAHRDGRIEDRWLGLHLREFALLWRLSEQPGEAVSCQQLLTAIWGTHFETQGSAVAVHMARLREKLAAFGFADLVANHPDGGYILDPAPEPAYPGAALDLNQRIGQSGA